MMYEKRKEDREKRHGNCYNCSKSLNGERVFRRCGNGGESGGQIWCEACNTKRRRANIRLKKGTL